MPQGTLEEGQAGYTPASPVPHPWSPGGPPRLMAVQPWWRASRLSWVVLPWGLSVAAVRQGQQPSPLLRLLSPTPLPPQGTHQPLFPLCFSPAPPTYTSSRGAPPPTSPQTLSAAKGAQAETEKVTVEGPVGEERSHSSCHKGTSSGHQSRGALSTAQRSRSQLAGWHSRCHMSCVHRGRTTGRSGRRCPVRPGSQLCLPPPHMGPRPLSTDSASSWDTNISASTAAFVQDSAD